MRSISLLFTSALTRNVPRVFSLSGLSLKAYTAVVKLDADKREMSMLYNDAHPSNVKSRFVTFGPRYVSNMCVKLIQPLNICEASVMLAPLKVDGNDVSDVQPSNIPSAFAMLAPVSDGNDTSDVHRSNMYSAFLILAPVNDGNDVSDVQSINI